MGVKKALILCAGGSSIRDLLGLAQMQRRHLSQAMHQVLRYCKIRRCPDFGVIHASSIPR